MDQIEIENVSFTYPGAPAPALTDVSLRIRRGSFVLLCGDSGSGKTTLLRLIKKQLRPRGALSGRILYRRTETEEAAEIGGLDDRTAAADFGFVAQQPGEGFVSDDVRSELSFGPECLGTDPDLIRRSTAEVCGFFGIGRLYGRRLRDLSGGERQLIKLASVAVCDPAVLLLDEPTAQLDPVAALSFLSSLRRLCDEEGVTVLIAEQRLGDLFPLADEAVLMEKGRVLFAGTPRETAARMLDTAHPLAQSLPAAARIWSGLGAPGSCPLTVREGIDLLLSARPSAKRQPPAPVPPASGEAVLELRDVSFAYSRGTPDVLRGIRLCARSGRVLAVLGANGSGKSTLLRVLSRTLKPQRGSYRIGGRDAGKYTGLTPVLPQDPRLLLTGDTVREDLTLTASRSGMDPELTARALGLGTLLERHPYDLSGGETQKAALCKLLLTGADILLLDEPTKGLDAVSRTTLCGLLRQLAAEGKCVVLVTHDAEFAADCADDCALLFDGQTVYEAQAGEFFSSGRYYTTAASRISRPLGLCAARAEELISCFEKFVSAP